MTAAFHDSSRPARFVTKLTGNGDMSYFYRLRNVDDYASEADFVWKSSYRPSGIDVPLPIDWTKAMREVPQNPPWPNCKVLRAPMVPEQYAQDYNVFVLKPGSAIPDLFCNGERALVSARAKSILEACDDFGHEYIETEIQNVDRERINESPYYLLSIRRYLAIDEVGGEVRDWKKMFLPRPREKRFLPTLQQTPELMKQVASLPLWRHRLDDSVIYMSAGVLNALRAAGLTGLKDYSH